MRNVTFNITDGLKKVMFSKEKKKKWQIVSCISSFKVSSKCHVWCLVKWCPLLTCVWAWRWVWWRGWLTRGCVTVRVVLHHGRGWVRQGVRYTWPYAALSTGHRGRCCDSPCLVGNGGGLVAWRYWCCGWRPQGFAAKRAWLCWGAVMWGQCSWGKFF